MSTPPRIARMRLVDDEKEKCCLVSSDAYLVKPVASNDLIGTIRACLIEQ